MKVIMKSKKIIILLLIGSCVYSCAGGEWTLKDRMEGLVKDNFRIYVRVNYDEEKESDAYQKQIDSEILVRAKRRCKTLLMSYIQSSIKEKEKKDRAFKLVSSIVNSSKVSYQNCFEKYCEAFVDFKAKQLKEYAGTTKK